MRLGPATRAAFVRGFLFCFSPLGGGMTASAEQRSKRVPHLPKPVADSSPRGLESATATVGQRPDLLHRTEWGRRPQRPGYQSRSRALSGFAPRQFTLENHRLPLALPQSFGKLRNFHVSLRTLSARSLRLARQKTCIVVQKLWTMIFPCGRRRKTKNYYSACISPARAKSENPEHHSGLSDADLGTWVEEERRGRAVPFTHSVFLRDSVSLWCQHWRTNASAAT